MWKQRLYALFVLSIALLFGAQARVHAEDAAALPHEDDGWRMDTDYTLYIESNAGWRRYRDNSHGLRPVQLVVGKGVTQLELPPFINQPEHYFPEENLIEPKKITVEQGNPVFVMQNGLLINNMTHTVVYADMQLKNALIPEGVTDIGTCAFQWRNIETVRFPASLRRIHTKAFHECDRLRSLRFPDTLESIGDKAFANCDGIRSITFSKSLQRIGPSAFRNCIKLTELVLPDSLQQMGWYAFECCEALERVRLPERMQMIGYFAFDHCLSLKEVVLPQVLQSTGEGVFNQCESLAVIELPAGVHAVDSWAFSDCNALKTLIVRARHPHFAKDALTIESSVENLLFFGAPPQGLDEAIPKDCTVYYLDEYAALWSPNGEDTWRGCPLVVTTRDEMETLAARLQREAEA